MKHTLWMRAVSALWIVGLAGCAPRGPSVLDAAGDAQSAPDAAVPTTPCEHAPVATLSAPCCTAYGADACGAGLFCAAFDGRTITTCYPLGVRMGGESCTEDLQCAGGRCSPSGHCAAMPLQPCNPTDGCADRPSAHYVCLDERCVRADGSRGAPCLGASDCDSSICFRDACSAGEIGDSCEGPEHCTSGFCGGTACTHGNEGSSCGDDADCLPGLECGPGAPFLECRRVAPASCLLDEDCPRGGCFASACVERRFRETCDSHPDCVGNPLIHPDLRCIGGACIDALESGEPCSDGRECASSICSATTRRCA